MRKILTSLFICLVALTGKSQSNAFKVKDNCNSLIVLDTVNRLSITYPKVNLKAIKQGNTVFINENQPTGTRSIGSWNASNIGLLAPTLDSGLHLLQAYLKYSCQIIDCGTPAACVCPTISGLPNTFTLFGANGLITSSLYFSQDTTQRLAVMGDPFSIHNGTIFSVSDSDQNIALEARHCYLGSGNKRGLKPYVETFCDSTQYPDPYKRVNLCGDYISAYRNVDGTKKLFWAKDSSLYAPRLVVDHITNLGTYTPIVFSSTFCDFPRVTGSDHSGVIEGTVNNASIDNIVEIQILFGSAYPAAPYIVASPNNIRFKDIFIVSQSPTGFTVRIPTLGSQDTFDFSFNYIAIN
jgi:hypothetical protein